VLIGIEYWAPLMAFMKDTLVRMGTIEQADLDRLYVTDSIDDAVSRIREAAIRKFGLHYRQKMEQPKSWLLEESARQKK
jgi:predicted Rossmann-fold nucleotide-binding protein